MSDLSVALIGEKCRSLRHWRDEMTKRRCLIFVSALTATAAALAAAGTPHGPAGLAAAMPDSPSSVTFRGTEYLLRSSQGNTYDFTPRGQEDLHSFTDMLELKLYPGADDQEALATITSRIQVTIQNAKGTILRTISVSASGQQPGEHLVAAMLPTSRGSDFGAVRFVLVDKQAAGVFYTHRFYSEPAAVPASAWVKRNAAEVEQQLLQFDASRMVSSVKVSTGPSLPAPSPDLPAGTIKKGTLTSPQLMHDTSLGVVGKVGMLGCNKVEGFTPYVVTPFSGATGVRQWQEKWLVKGCGKEYPVDIEFKEDGAGGADWTIRK